MTANWRDDPAIRQGIEISKSVEAEKRLNRERGRPGMTDAASAQEPTVSATYRALLPPLICRACTDSGRKGRTILAIYAAPGGVIWLWLAGYRSVVNLPNGESELCRIPPTAYRYRPGLMNVAMCQQCGFGQPFLVLDTGALFVGYEPAPPTRATLAP